MSTYSLHFMETQDQAAVSLMTMQQRDRIGTAYPLMAIQAMGGAPNRKVLVARDLRERVIAFEILRFDEQMVTVVATGQHPELFQPNADASLAYQGEQLALAGGQTVMRAYINKSDPAGQAMRELLGWVTVGFMPHGENEDEFWIMEKPLVRDDAGNLTDEG